MPHAKLFAIVTAVMLLGGPSVAQENVSLQELRTIETLIAAQEWQQLRAYIVANPHLVAGGDPLAVELRAFMNDMRRGWLNLFRAHVNPGGNSDTGASSRDIY